MKKENKKIEVALPHYLCPVCCKVAEEVIVMNSKLTEKAAQQVKEIDRKPIGFSDKLCKDCQKIVDEKDGFFIIGVDEEKTEDWSNPYRSGHIVAIKKSSEFYKNLEDKFKLRDWVYMDYKTMQHIRLIKEENV